MAEYHAPEAPRGEASGAYGDAQTAPRWDDAPSNGALGRASYAVGSLVSVGLVVGLAVWGYQLVARDVSGVPVIRAATGPMRVQPEDPGGRQAQNQGLSVNAIAAVGTAGKAPDQLILAPAPLDLTEDDAPVAPNTRQEDTASATRPAAAPAPQEEPASTAAIAGTSEEAGEDGSDAMLALADVLSEGVAPMTPLADAPADAPGDEQSPEDAAVAAAVASAAEAADDAEATRSADASGTIARSLRPKARPADLSNIRQVAATRAAGTREIDPGSIAVGTRLAQLGAFSSEEIAREEWTKLGARFDEYLADKDRVIQRASSGGRTFYRLRAHGFEDLADARRFCSALVAEKAECIPVVTR